MKTLWKANARAALAALQEGIGGLILLALFVWMTYTFGDW